MKPELQAPRALPVLLVCRVPPASKDRPDRRDPRALQARRVQLVLVVHKATSAPLVQPAPLDLRVQLVPRV